MIHSPSSAKEETLWQFNDSQTRELLICFIWVLKNYSPRLLCAHWQSQNVPTPFFNLLQLALETFHYEGRRTTFTKLLDAPIEKHQMIK